MPELTSGQRFQTYRNGSAFLTSRIRVIDDTLGLRVAGSTEIECGIIAGSAKPGEPVGVVPTTPGNSCAMIAAGAIAKGADVYRAVNGQVSATGTSKIGRAVNSSLSAGDEIIVLVTPGGDSSQSLTAPWSSGISFTNPFITYGQLTQTGNISFSKITANAIPGATSVSRVIASGSHTVSYPGFREMGGSMGFDNRSGITNVFMFFYDGIDYWVNIFQELNAQPIDIVAPTLSTAVVPSVAPNTIVLTYSEALLSTAPATSAFTVSGGKTVSSVSIAGSAVTITVNSAYINSDVITVSYVPPGSNPISDASGNLAAALTNQAVTNNIGTTTPLTFSDSAGWSVSGTTYTSTTSSPTALSDYKITGDGWFQYRAAASSAATAIIGFHDVAVRIPYSSGMLYYSWTDATNVYRSPSVTGAGTWSAGDYFRLDRTAGVVTLKKSSDGVTFTTIGTFSGTSTGDLFLELGSFSSGVVVTNPVGFGVVPR